MGVGLIEARLHRSQERTAAYQVLDLTVFLARDDRVLAFPDSFIWPGSLGVVNGVLREL